MRHLFLAAFTLSLATSAFAEVGPKTGQVNAAEHQKRVEEQAQRIRAYRKAMKLDQIAAPEGLKEMPLYVGTPKPAPVQTVEGPTHIVVKGDTLYSISKRYQVELDALKSANSIEGTSIRLGQSLIIPARKEAYASRIRRIVEPVTAADEVLSVSDLEKPQAYAVVPKDTLFAIAKRTCTTTDALIQLNDLSDANTLKPGQMLALPENHCLKR